MNNDKFWDAQIRQPCSKCAEKDAEIARLSSTKHFREATLKVTLELQKENDDLMDKLEITRKALVDIQSNYDCNCVQGDRTRGYHKCQSCLAKEALEQIKE